MTKEGSSNTENTREWSRLRWVCSGVKVGFKLLSGRGQGWRDMNLIWMSIPNSGSIKSKTITKLLDRFINRRVELWNNKEIATTLAAPSTVGRKICNKIPRKNCVKKLANKYGCLKHHALFYRKPMKSTGVILVYRLVLDTILAALFCMHCNVHRLNLERFLKSELQQSNRLLTRALATSTELS